ncbi:TetR/AcrR family transcriptional regulator [Peterkaempfera griseoplana]|uniref:TetR/AcrR family transcriptional regulator n=1 Tax=Peterkaempfera griseoplana TaxID=66896 RepID=UPI0006E3A3A5|nr:TetR/AcrR family transcriptional regulator [Peterkaempfera griseoplana]
MPYRRTPAVQARLDSRRDALLRAAVELLAEQGYTGCSVAAVAERAGIATGSVYQHFTGKAELAVELFRTVVGGEVAAVTAAAGNPALTPQQRVTAVVETFAARALRSPRLAYALLAEPVDPAVDAERLVFRRTFRDVIAAQVAAGVAAGDLPRQDAELTAAALVGAVGEALVGPLAAGAAPTDLVPALLSFTVRALGGHHAADS